jgi:bifunctional UDP-N-acetylglucosamine pyrophosphorylase/glucosamine-1-phosphate N-acetyltransferase
VERIVEHKDANDEELAVNEVSALVYLFDAAALTHYLPLVGSENSQGEYYLPDVIGLMRADDLTVLALLAPAAETAGVNDRVQLAQAHRAYNDRLLAEHMRNGVTVVDPATTWIDASVSIEADATIKPNVQLIGSCRVATGAVIGPDSTLTDTVVGADAILQRVVANQASIGDRATVGPYAYLRPGTVLSDEVHVGTYVEIKASDVGIGSKIPHLSYVGDASIGEHSNIGAATVFVNYDGVNKHRSRIGSHARTGADNMFVAPVTVGDGAYTAAGSIITKDVPPGALGVARAQQRNIDGWVQRTRAGTSSAVAASEASSRAASSASAQSASAQSPSDMENSG